MYQHPQMPSHRDHKALNRGTSEGVGRGIVFWTITLYICLLGRFSVPCQVFKEKTGNVWDVTGETFEKTLGLPLAPRPRFRAPLFRILFEGLRLIP